MMPNNGSKVFLLTISSDGNNLAQEDRSSLRSGVAQRNVKNSDVVPSWRHVKAKKALQKKAQMEKIS
jgi:hypothetical protein